MKRKIVIVLTCFLVIGVSFMDKTPARYLVQDIVTKQLGISNGQVFTELDLSEAQLAELDKQVKLNLPNRPANVSVLERNFNSAYQVQNILGKYRVTYSDDYYIISDVYDFNRHSKVSDNPIVGFFESAAKKYGHSDRDTYDSKMKFNIKIKYSNGK